MDDQPPRKFMFDRSFDGLVSANRAPPERRPVTLKPEQVEALKQEAYNAGFAAGRKAESDSQTQKMTVALTAIERRMEALFSGIKEWSKNQDAHIRATTMAIARKLLPEFTDRHGFDEIVALLNKAIPDMVHEPRLVIYVHADQLDDIKTKINEITTQKAYSGETVILADAAIARGDCRIEWGDGALARSTESSWKDIEQVVAPEATAM